MKSEGGFTLIETIVYLALFAMVIGQGMVAAYQIIQATDASSNHLLLQEEANFLLRKITWALNGATSLNASYSPPVLSVTNNGQVLTFNMDANNNLRLARGSGSPVPLNSSSLVVSNLSFLQNPGGLLGVTFSFTLTTRKNGRAISEDFSITKYLEK